MKTPWAAKFAPVAAFTSLLLLCIACDRKELVTRKPKIGPWHVENLDPTISTPALLWNGLIGLRMGRYGCSPEGYPGVFRLEEIEQYGEEKIRPLPVKLKLWTDELSLTPERTADYHERLDFKTGALHLSWIDKTTKNLIHLTTVISPSKELIAQQATISSAQVELYPRIQGPSHLIRLQPQLSESVVSNTRIQSSWHVSRGKIVRHDQKIDGDLLVIRSNDQPIVFERTVCFSGSQDKTSNTLPSFATVAKESTTLWNSRWKTDIIIDGPMEDQQAVRSLMFYLASAIHPKKNRSISPLGLSNQVYNGHIFWDADAWVFPAIALLYPEQAKAIPSYRLEMGKKQSGSQIQFPWESSVTGKEVAPPEPRKQIHVTGTALFWLNKAAQLGLADRESVNKIGKKAALFFLEKSYIMDKGLRGIRDVMSPDEFHIGDNDLYTNMLAQWTVNSYLSKGRARDIEFYLPKDEVSLLTYDGDALRSYKQAAAVLSIFPLQHPNAETQAKAMMERFVSKTIENGPAMSDSVHATIWARLGKEEKAYSTWQKGWKDFTNHPLLLFSEKRRKEVTYFTTGAGGCLQTVLYGFAGLRFDSKVLPTAKWSWKLEQGGYLNLIPNLPSKWKSLTIKNLSVLGKNYHVYIDHNSVKVTQGDD